MLEGRHYQNAYVTRNIKTAIEAFKARSDIRKLIEYEATADVVTPKGPVVQKSKLAFIWVGDLQYELIEPISGADIFRDALPADESIVFHHICMRVPEWDKFRARVDRQDCQIVLERNTDPSLKFLYLDARKFVGHYLEYVWMTDERWTQLGGR